MFLLDELGWIYRTELNSRGPEWCERVAKLAELGNEERYKQLDDPVKRLLNELHKKGISLDELKRFDRKASVPITDGPDLGQICRSPPSIKIALLIGNKDYEHWNDLFCPESDCEHLAERLESMGYITITFINYTAAEIRMCIEKLFQLVPYDAYWFIYCAGHGIELNAFQGYLVGVECPRTDYTHESLVSRSFIKRKLLERKPKLCVIVYDMCRKSPEKEKNPQIPVTEECDCNFLEVYATSSSKPAFEFKHEFPLEMESTSLYMKYLRVYLLQEKDLTEIFQLVHKGIEDFTKNCDDAVLYSKPEVRNKLVGKYYLRTPAHGDNKAESLIERYKVNPKRMSKKREEESTRQV